MGAQASSFDHVRQTATEVVESSLHSALHNNNSNATSVDILRTGEIKLANQQISQHEQKRGSIGQQQATSPISISENNQNSLSVLGRQSSLSANNNSSSSSSSSAAAAGAVAVHNRSLKNDFDFDHKDDDNQFSGCGSPYSRRRVRQEEERHTDVKSPSTPLPKTSTATVIQPQTQQMQFVRGVSTDNSDLNRNNYESNTNNETNKNCSAHRSNKSKSSKKRSSSRSSIWQRFTSTTTSSSASLTPAAKKSTSTVALNIHHQSGTATSGQSDATEVSHKTSVSGRNDADESQLLNQPLRKRSLTESVSLKRSAERRTQSRTRDRKFSSKQQTAPVINQTSSTAESDNSSTVSSCRPTSSHGSLLSGKHQQQSSNSIIGSNARRAVAEGLSKLMIPFRNSTRSTSSAENVVESSSSVEKMATKAAATKTKTTTTPGPTTSTASTTSSNRPSSSSSSVKDSAPFSAASTSFAPDVPEVFVAASVDEPPPTSPTNSKIPIFKLAGVPQPPHHSCSTSTLLLAKDVEQLSLSSGSGSGAGGGGGGTAHTHHSQVHHGGGSHIVHVGGGTRRNSRPRESPVHQARSNIIAENMQALLQTDATTGALLQEHLSESHRGAIHTSMMSPTSNEAIGGSHGGSGGGDYDLYYAAQAQANDAACQRDKFSVALSRPAVAGPAGGGAVTTKKSAAPSQVGGGGNNAVLKPFMSTGAGGLAIRRKSRTDEIRAYIAAGNNEENSANEKSTANSITTGSGDGATNKLQQHQRHSEDLVTTTTTTSLDDDDLQPKAVAPSVVDKAASAASLQSADKNFFDSAKPSVTPTDATTTSSSSGKPLPTTTVLTKVPAPHQHRIATEQPMVAEMLNNQVWKRLTEKSMLQKSSSSDMLKCVGAFLHRRFAHLSHLFQPNEPVLWMRGVDRSLIAQGWQDMAFLSPANIVFVYMLLRTLDGHLAGNLRQLQAHVLTALYVAYSYMGHEISYPVRLFLAADVEHKERFWLRCMRLVDDAGDNMLRINNDPLLFSALFHELIAHLRYIQPPPPPPPPPLAPLQTPSSLTALPSQPSSSDMDKSAVTPSAEIVAGSTSVDTAKTDDAKSVDRNTSSAVNDVPNQTDISDAVKETNSNLQKSKMR